MRPTRPGSLAPTRTACPSGTAPAASPAVQSSTRWLGVITEHVVCSTRPHRPVLSARQPPPQPPYPLPPKSNTRTPPKQRTTGARYKSHTQATTTTTTHTKKKTKSAPPACRVPPGRGTRRTAAAQRARPPRCREQWPAGENRTLLHAATQSSAVVPRARPGAVARVRVPSCCHRNPLRWVVADACDWCDRPQDRRETGPGVAGTQVDMRAHTRQASMCQVERTV